MKRLCFKQHGKEELWLLPLPPRLRGDAHAGEMDFYMMAGDLSDDLRVELFTKREAN